MQVDQDMATTVISKLMEFQEKIIRPVARTTLVLLISVGPEFLCYSIFNLCWMTMPVSYAPKRTPIQNTSILSRLHIPITHTSGIRALSHNDQIFRKYIQRSPDLYRISLVDEFHVMST